MVEPKRTATNHRLYSQNDIERLGLLRNVTHAGHNISQVALLSNDQLRALAANAPGRELQAPRAAAATPAASALLDECLASVQSLAGRALDDTLKRAATTLGAQGVIHRLVAPLTQTLGDLWREDKITTAHEHFATGHLRAFLGNLAKPFGGSESAPALVVATPDGQLHEMGALLVGALAANLGWEVTCLGAVNDVRIDYAGTEDGDANLRVLMGGKAGEGRVTETAGVRGIDESDLKSAAYDDVQLHAMTANRVDDAAATPYAWEHERQATAVAYENEAKRGKTGKSGGTPDLSAATGMFGSLGQGLGSMLGTADKVMPEPEEELSAEELGLGPEIAGRVLGARPLWNDAEAQKRVNLIGHWIAMQTSRPDLPWVSGKKHDQVNNLVV